MGSLFERITDWIKEGLIEAITGQYTGIFESVNSQVSDVASQVGQTPQGWNGGVFSMIQNLSETVVIPIAGIILTFVLVYELIQMILEKNNMHDFDTFNIFKWIFKTFVATYLLTNCFTIVMAVFDVAQNVVSQSAGVINGNLDVTAALADLETQLEAMGISMMNRAIMTDTRRCTLSPQVAAMSWKFSRRLWQNPESPAATPPPGGLVLRMTGPTPHGFLKWRAVLSLKPMLR